MSPHADAQTGQPGPRFLGRHVLAEFWGCRHVDDPVYVERALARAARDAGATALGSSVHHFGHGLGVTGIIMLAESHISIHSWPEFGYAAVDVFVCGKADPHLAVASLQRAFHPAQTGITEHFRGAPTSADALIAAT
ncbi:adenosylmethionine decarboxylase [Tistrella sp. BH-R2-4]|uniref:S-adenosylmethionine decarboxylase proenzyme n=1 Tax=Tistrella arctica TaxID=3133430 RepID=A0ABU9YSP9_9PROT